MLVALSGQIIIIAVSGFEGIIQRFEVTATGMNIFGTCDTDKEHCSLYCLVIFNKYGCYTWWWGCEGLEGCIYSAQLSVWMLTGYVLLIKDGNCFCLTICESYVLMVNFTGLIGYYVELVNTKLHIFEAVVLCFVWAHQ